ncbi:MAG: hypothetical protein NTZ94_06300 [Verrucomicrobia bacterium]|nr:hypothetical protein [Verrucomicrobiota bacterium]
MTHFRHDINREKNSLRIGEIFAGLNFGTAEIDWALKKIALTVRNSEGAPVIKTEVEF